MRRAVLILTLSQVLWGHGLHEDAMRVKGNQGLSLSQVEVKELSSAIAVQRTFPLSFELCAQLYYAEDSYCFVSFVESVISHHDYTFPVPAVDLPNGDAVTLEANERGYTVHYFGNATTVETQLGQIKEAFRFWNEKGIKSVTSQLFRPQFPDPVPLHPFSEKKMGDMVGVLRKIPIRYSECLKSFKENACWVHVLEESEPDHPGPAGGGDVAKEYFFSENEKVTVSIENLYSDYLINYQGPESSADKILSKIKVALDKLKGNAKELSIECTMFTIKRNKPLPGDTVISGTTFFEIAMPLQFETCEKTLDPETQNCGANFIPPISPSVIDHPGGNEIYTQKVENEGVVEVYGSYVEGNPFWRLHYERLTGAVLQAKEFLKRGFDLLKSLGKDKIHAYGFHTP